MGKVLFSIFISMLLGGCGSRAPEAPEQPACRVVTQVEIRDESPSVQTQRLYSTQENINRVLDGITRLGHKYRSGEMPAPWEQDAYRITLYFSDGNQKIYRYHPLRYLHIQHRGWTRVNEEKSRDFLALLQQLPEE